MKIPLGEFGFNTGAGGVPSPNVGPGAFVRQGLDSVGDGVGAMGRVGGDIAIAKAHDAFAESERLRHQQEAEAKHAAAQLAAEAKHTKAIALTGEVQNLLMDSHTSLRNGIIDGKVDPEEAGALWKKHSEVALDSLLKDQDPQIAARVRAGLVDNIGNLGRDLGQAVTVRHRSDIRANLDASLEQFGRLWLKDSVAARNQGLLVIDANGDAAGLSPAEKQKMKQAFVETGTFNASVQFLNQNRNNARALTQFIDALPKNPDIDPQKQNMLMGQAERQIQHLASMGEIAERRRLNAVQMQATRLGWYVEHGRDIPPAEFDAFTKSSKGTPFEGMAQAIVAEQKAVGEIANLPPAQMLDKVRQIEAGYGATPSKEQITHVAKLKTFTSNTIKALQESPLTFSVEREGAKVAPLDMLKPDAWGDNLSHRAAILTEQTKRTGADPKGLFPQEVAMFRSALEGVNVGQKREILANLRKGFGDDKVYRATLQQIAPDDPVTQNAGIMAARGLTDNTGRVVADYILRGQAALRQDKTKDGQPGKGGLIPMPHDDKLLPSFNDYTGNAFANAEKSRSGFLQTAKAIYAARSIDDGDFSGEIKAARWQSAVELATGNVDRYKGRDVVLPYGMDAGKFRDELRDRVDLMADKLPPGMTLDRVHDIPMVNIGDGRYQFQAGDGALYGKDGKPLVIDFNQPIPAGAVMRDDPRNAARMRARMGGNNRRNRLE